MWVYPYPQTRRKLGRPWATYALIAVNALIYVATALLLDADYPYRYGFIPARDAPLTWFTSMFLHAGLLHLLGNMLFLWVFGAEVEDVLGSVLFLPAYVLSGLSATAFWALLNPGSTQPCVGASGAISGVVGLYMVLRWRVRTELYLDVLVFTVKKFYLSALGAGAAWLAFQAAMALLSELLRRAGLPLLNIAFWAHVGGLLGGAGLGLLFVMTGFARRYEERLAELSPPVAVPVSGPAVEPIAGPAPQRRMRGVAHLALRKPSGNGTRGGRGRQSMPILQKAAGWVLILLIFAGTLGWDRYARLPGRADPLKPVPVQAGARLPATQVLSPQNVYDAVLLAVWRQEPGAGVQDFAFSPDGAQMALTTHSGELRLWQAADGRLLHTVQPYDHGVWVPAIFGLSGTLVVSGDGPFGQKLDFWQVRNGQLTARTSVSTDWGVTALAVSPDGQRCASAGMYGADLWQLPDGVHLAELQASPDDVSGIAFSPDGTLLATAARHGAVRVVRLADNGTQWLEYGAERDHFYGDRGLAFSPDGSRVASSSASGKVHIWSAVDGRQISTLQVDNNLVYDLAYSPDGALLATASAKGTVWLWRAHDGSALFPLLHGDASDRRDVFRVAFSPDGRLLVTVADGGVVRVWGVRR